MSITQSTFSGVPILNGIWYRDNSYVPYALTDGRLTAGVRIPSLPEEIHRRKGRPYYTNNQCFERSESLQCGFQCGVLEPMKCAYLAAIPANGEPILWIASFSYFEQFEQIRFHGKRITVRTTEGQMVMFDAEDPMNVRVSLCAEPGMIVKN